MSGPLARPRVDPRMRERWIAARRAEGRRRLRMVVAASAVGAVIVLAVAVLESPLMAVRHLRISGARHESHAQVAAVGGVRLGTHMISVRPAQAEARLERLPWVAHAVVTRQWPDSVTVHLVERVAVAQVAAGHQTVLVDGAGEVLSAPAAPVPGLPVLAGAGAAPAAGAVLATKGATSEALAVAALLPPALAAEVKQLRPVSGGMVADVYATSPPTASPAKGAGATSPSSPAASTPTVPASFGGPTNLAEKVTDLEAIVAKVDLAHVKAIDLTIPGRPVLTGSPKPTNVSSTAGG